MRFAVQQGAYAFSLPPPPRLLFVKPAPRVDVSRHIGKASPDEKIFPLTWFDALRKVLGVGHKMLWFSVDQATNSCGASNSCGGTAWACCMGLKRWGAARTGLAGAHTRTRQESQQA
jgi:hypothetical protein